MANTPGVNFKTRTVVTPQTASVLTDTTFVVGVTQLGRTDQPVLIRSIQDYISNFGARQSWDTLYDWLDAFFNEAGGGSVYVMRCVGPGAAVDTATFNDAGAAAAISVTGVGKGATGLSALIQSGVAAGSFQIVVTGSPDGSVVTSPDLFTEADAVNWGRTQLLFRVNALGTNAPANHAVVALAGGDDDRANVNDTVKLAQLNAIPKGLGCGQVVVPGSTTEAIYVGLVNHAIANNRFALLSASDSASETTVAGLAATLQADGAVTPGALEYGALFADWQQIPGLTPQAVRTVPPTAIVAALIARSDKATFNPNLAPAGSNGQVQYAIGKTQADWTDAQITALTLAGVNAFHYVFGGERLYGFRTLANPSSSPVFVMASAARLRMAIIQYGFLYGQAVLMGQIDGQGHEAAKYGGLISGLLLRFYGLGALYGATAEEAYVVDTGPDVNTPTTIANRELHAAVGIVPSPFAETVWFELASFPVNVPV